MDFENEYDKILNIKTTGRDDTNYDFKNFPYEPTPYIVLQRLASSGYITKKNYLLDYGCGKGRVDFYMSYETSCHCIGVEYSSRIFNRAICNKKTAIKPYKVEFILDDASNYDVPTNIDRVYYFNPFCVEILDKTIFKIKESYQKCNRQILLFFYYPIKKYIDYLEKNDNLKLIDIIDVKDLFEQNNNEQILIYELTM